MRDALLALAAFFLTAAETSVGTSYTRAVVAVNIRHAVFWGVLFEALLLVDIWFLMTTYWLAVPILLGAGVGIWWTLNRKLRSTQKVNEFPFFIEFPS